MRYFVWLFINGVHEAQPTDGVLYTTEERAEEECRIWKETIGDLKSVEWRVIPLTLHHGFADKRFGPKQK